MRGPGPYLLILPIVLSSCLTPQTQAKLDRAEKRVELLDAKIAKETLRQEERLSDLQQQLSEAKAKLAIFEATPGADSTPALVAINAIKAQIAQVEQANANSMATLQKQLAKAEKNLTTTRAKADDERVENGAAAVEQSANALSPLLGLFLPGATLALGAIGIGAGAIRKKKAAKRKAAEAAAGGK